MGGNRQVEVGNVGVVERGGRNTGIAGCGNGMEMCQRWVRRKAEGWLWTDGFKRLRKRIKKKINLPSIRNCKRRIFLFLFLFSSKVVACSWDFQHVRRSRLYTLFTLCMFSSTNLALITLPGRLPQRVYTRLYTHASMFLGSTCRRIIRNSCVSLCL